MAAPAFDKLHVMVTGVGAAVARDVARLIAGEGASVIAADRDAATLAGLERDLGLYRVRIETAQIDLACAAEVRLWEASLGALGRLPHMLICCCGVREGAPEASHAALPASDVALCDCESRDCPAVIAERVLRPALFLHAQPLRGSAFNRALSVLRHPTLRGVLERAPGQGLFNPARVAPYVRIATRLYSLHRPADADPPSGRRVRLVSPEQPSRRASAA